MGLTWQEEEKIYTHQSEVIEKRYGHDEVNKANFGWGVDEVTGEVSTKIYGPWVCLTTRLQDGRFIDTWEDLA